MIFIDIKYQFFKKRGLYRLSNFEVQKAIIDLKKALTLVPSDKDLHFALACAYSLLENAELGFYHLHCIVEYTKRYQEDILNEDKLAYLRIQPTYEAFYRSYLI